MRRRLCVIALLLTGAWPVSGVAADRFGDKLPADRQAAHVLNRLTFGARAGDLAEVKRLGVEKWIDLQLHPERIPENPELARRLDGLATLQLPTWQILANYPLGAVVIRFESPLQSLTPFQACTLTTGGPPEARRAVIDSLNPELRRQLLANGPRQAIDGLSDLQQEANAARQADQQARQMEFRRLMPPLTDLLTPDQIRIARTGTDADRLALFASLEGEKRTQVLRALGPQALVQFSRPAPRVDGRCPACRRTSNQELIDNKLLRAIYSNRQLEEVLVDFWMNHFNVYNGKGPGPHAAHQLRARCDPAVRVRDISKTCCSRPRAIRRCSSISTTGNRRCRATTLPRRSDGTPRARPGLNENYGRELMELHTLGVDGGYTQQDVIAVARAFTGWTIYDPKRMREFQFNPAMHDRKEKVVLGHTIPAGRRRAGWPRSASISLRTIRRRRRSSRRSWRNASLPTIRRSRSSTAWPRRSPKPTATFAQCCKRCSLRREFLSEGAWQAKLKSPLEMVVSAVRAVNADVTDTFAARAAHRRSRTTAVRKSRADRLSEYGRRPGPTRQAFWDGSILRSRSDGGARFPESKVDIEPFQLQDARRRRRRAARHPPSAATLAAIEKGIQSKEATPSMLASLVIGSPDFQRR